MITRAQKRRVVGFISTARGDDGLALLGEGSIAADAPPGGLYVDADAASATCRPTRPGAGRNLRAGAGRSCRFDDEDEAIAHRQRHALRPRRRRLDARRRRARCGSPARSARARCSSTITAPAAASSCRSAASSNPATAARKGFEALYGFTALEDDRRQSRLTDCKLRRRKMRLDGKTALVTGCWMDA